MGRRVEPIPLSPRQKMLLCDLVFAFYDCVKSTDVPNHAWHLCDLMSTAHSPVWTLEYLTAVMTSGKRPADL